MKVFPCKTAVCGIVAACLGVALGACQGTTDLKSSRATPPGAEDGPTLAQFTDIPIPAGATMDVPRSLILGPGDAWIGRLVFRTSAGVLETLAFYSREMPAFSWQEITRVRSEVSVLTYVRGARAATIQIAGTTLGGSEVNVTVSPKAQGVGGGNGVRSAPLN